MQTTPNQRTCLITGSRGYLGSCIKSKFLQEGWNVLELIRNPDTEAVRAGKAISFRLGEDISPQQLRSADALVHCAYDFSLRDWHKIHSVNVLGTEKLFTAARHAGISKRVFISSMSAFEGCHSLYGKAKLETEQKLAAGDVLLVRPGLIYGDHPRGIVGNLVKQAKISSLLLLFGDGLQILYLSHQADLSQMICDHASGQLSAAFGPVTTAHEQGWTLRSILEELARAQGRKLYFIKVPWQSVWLLLKCAELIHLPLAFRSDSLVSLMHQNLHPSFDLTRQMGLKFRPFQPKNLKL